MTHFVIVLNINTSYFLLSDHFCILTHDDLFCLMQSVYVKDDFFDSLSYGALDREHGKPEHLKSSEQRKIDKEVKTFFLIANIVKETNSRHISFTSFQDYYGKF